MRGAERVEEGKRNRLAGSAPQGGYKAPRSTELKLRGAVPALRPLDAPECAEDTSALLREERPAHR